LIALTGSGAGCAAVPIEDIIRSLPIPSEAPSRESRPDAVIDDRMVEVHWSHPAPASVERFKIYWGLEKDSYLAVEDVTPRRRGDGTFVADLRVPANRTVHMAVSAVGSGGESARSNLGVCEPGCLRARPTRAAGGH
jgi:hypothetical protein